MRTILILPAIMAMGLAACGSPEPEATTDDMAMATETPAMRQATATLQMADGTPAGTATAMETANGVTITLAAQGVPAGPHGVHVHMTGACEAPGFTSAGGHWNPANTQHGMENPEGQHAGDMPNLTVAEDGSGTLEYTLEGGTFDALMDADGSAFVIHAGEDDQMTDPAGDSGDRIACGVFSTAA